MILSSKKLSFLVAVGAVGVLLGFSFTHQAQAESAQPVSGQRLLAVHDDNAERGLLTRATTLREAFKEAHITIDPNDRVEPGLDEELVASNYEVNIYRARPVTIVDGETHLRIMSTYHTAKQIAQQAGLPLHDEDVAKMTAGTDVGRGLGVQLAITRATEFTLGLYGKKTTAYTQATTVEAMLKEKGIALGNDDTVSVALDAKMQSGMAIEIWRNGAQTTTEEQAIPFEIQKILDVDRPIGYHEIKTKGVAGTRLITYEITMQDGKETSRKQIQSVLSSEPMTQVELIGNKPVNPLSKTKGADYFTDSQGVSHRETYYDLPMSAVMGACGGGTYTIRADGAKVDKDGYILIAGDYSRYPRCSIVETSMGLGKVYDTGGFVARYPDGFDLATDWSNYDGR